MTKILLSVDKMDASFENLFERLSAVADVSVVGLEGFDLTDVVIFIGKRLSVRELATANKLKAVFTYKTGVDEFALDKLNEMGVILCNSHANSVYIAQYAFALALALTARVVEYDKNLRQGDWSANLNWKSLFNMKVGLVGYGGIGKEIHKLLYSNGIATYTLNRGKTYENIITVDTLVELCEATDLLILSLPKTAETNDMFDAEIFSHLAGKYIVNVGRGNCIDEEALYQSLVNGEVAGAAIDTWRLKSKGEQKLFPSQKHFERLNNVLLSPHKAMMVDDGHDKYVMDVLDNVLAYLDTKSPRNVVNLNKGY
ncbi:MAG: hypothetical protein J1F66_03550 [Clostridiales bacterium]|nr:hypothetical protein [Clostridiales bacterium]